MPRAGSKEALELQVARLQKKLAQALGELRPPAEAITALGPPPSDPLGVPSYLCKALAIAAHEVMTDPKLPASTRRRELRALAGQAVRLIPRSRIWEAEQFIRADRAKIEERARGAELEPVPPMPERFRRHRHKPSDAITAKPEAPNA